MGPRIQGQVREPPTRQADSPARRDSWLRAHWLDVAVVVTLSVVAFLMRRGGLPVDGLWFDDSWVAAGATEGSLRQLMTVGSGHPGFTAGLMGLNELTGGELRSLAYPALVAGTVGPAVLYLGLGRFGYARSVALLLGAALVVADIHVLFGASQGLHTRSVARAGSRSRNSRTYRQ